MAIERDPPASAFEAIVDGLFGEELPDLTDEQPAEDDNGNQPPDSDGEL